MLMTANNNSNGDTKHTNPEPNAGGTEAKSNLDETWAAFEAAHSDDLNDVASSRQARKFEKQARRREKEALLHVNDLDLGTFTDDSVPLRERIRQDKANGQSGPRDFTGSSWLDTDDVMDQYGDDFVPPNPQIGPIRTSKLVFWVLLLIGVFGIIAAVFVPSLATLLGTVCGLCTLLGAAGLIIQHKGHNETKTDDFDDGARV